MPGSGGRLRREAERQTVPVDYRTNRRNIDYTAEHRLCERFTDYEGGFIEYAEEFTDCAAGFTDYEGGFS